jgi:hypothetical protein
LPGRNYHTFDAQRKRTVSGGPRICTKETRRTRSGRDAVARLSH